MPTIDADASSSPYSAHASVCSGVCLFTWAHYCRLCTLALRLAAAVVYIGATSDDALSVPEFVRPPKAPIARRRRRCRRRRHRHHPSRPWVYSARRVTRRHACRHRLRVSISNGGVILSDIHRFRVCLFELARTYTHVRQTFQRVLCKKKKAQMDCDFGARVWCEFV